MKIHIDHTYNIRVGGIEAILFHVRRSFFVLFFHRAFRHQQREKRRHESYCSLSMGAMTKIIKLVPTVAIFSLLMMLMQLL